MCCWGGLPIFWWPLLPFALMKAHHNVNTVRQYMHQPGVSGVGPSTSDRGRCSANIRDYAAVQKLTMRTVTAFTEPTLAFRQDRSIIPLFTKLAFLGLLQSMACILSGPNTLPSGL